MASITERTIKNPADVMNDANYINPQTHHAINEGVIDPETSEVCEVMGDDEYNLLSHKAEVTAKLFNEWPEIVPEQVLGEIITAYAKGLSAKAYLKQAGILDEVDAIIVKFTEALTVSLTPEEAERFSAETFEKKVAPKEAPVA